jgi:homocysteine S-methyltransferase
MATDVEERFQGPLVLDGGMATELERGGADLRDALWSARLLKDDPAAIRRVHEAFFDAGADVAISASYQASFSGFADRGIEAEEAASLMRLSVALAREAAEVAAADGSDRLVAASVGPFGATLADGSEYRGDYGLSAGALAMFHRPRFETLLEAEPDLLAIETIPSIVEAEAMVTLLEDYPEARAWISFSCRDGTCVSDGTPFADALALAASSDRVIAVGVNCTPPGFIPSLLDGAEVTKPLLAYPNVGSTWDAEARAWILEGERPDPGMSAVTWRAAGATIVGGCCGTTPDDIRAIAASQTFGA